MHPSQNRQNSYHVLKCLQRWLLQSWLRLNCQRHCYSDAWIGFPLSKFSPFPLNWAYLDTYTGHLLLLYAVWHLLPLFCTFWHSLALAGTSSKQNQINPVDGHLLLLQFGLPIIKDYSFAIKKTIKNFWNIHISRSEKCTTGIQEIQYIETEKYSVQFCLPAISN